MSENENEEMMQEEGPEQEPSVPAQSTFYPGGYPEVEPGQPMTLDSLQDPPPGTKPRYPYSTLIRFASPWPSSHTRAPSFHALLMPLQVCDQRITAWQVTP